MQRAVGLQARQLHVSRSGRRRSSAAEGAAARAHLVRNGCAQARERQAQQARDGDSGAGGRVDVALQRGEREAPEPARVVLAGAEAHLFGLQVRHEGVALARVQQEAHKRAQVHCARAAKKACRSAHATHAQHAAWARRQSSAAADALMPNSTMMTMNNRRSLVTVSGTAEASPRQAEPRTG
jgi:hypothetical protein